MEYKGTLIAFDGYMNLQLFNTEEWVNGECKGNIGEALIRCNNVLYIRDAEGIEEIWFLDSYINITRVHKFADIQKDGDLVKKNLIIN